MILKVSMKAGVGSTRSFTFLMSASDFTGCLV